MLVLTRRLSRTPLGLIALGVGWWLVRKRKERMAMTGGDPTAGPRAPHQPPDARIRDPRISTGRR
ncbi:hypothetical protein Misp01_50680 [Microtetraspora sp. NBRC 13810]|nr:hypothetical protein Misp01_50680 [Microtetraspora sp. NBRC 13810]